MRKLPLVVLTALFILFTAHDAHALCVKVAKANLRTGPGTSYDVVWEIFKYMPLVKVGVSVSGKWYAVKDVDGDVTWIYRDLVTSGYHCAVVKTETVNVRTGPGTRYRKSTISPAKQYYSFKVEKRKGSWVKVKDEWGGRGWIHRHFLFIR
ncbi:MAG: SH3 domain-containing protein [Candidatus Sulfobium sp.]